MSTVDVIVGVVVVPISGALLVIVLLRVYGAVQAHLTPYRSIAEIDAEWRTRNTPHYADLSILRPGYYWIRPDPDSVKFPQSCHEPEVAYFAEEIRAFITPGPDGETSQIITKAEVLSSRLEAPNAPVGSP